METYFDLCYRESNNEVNYIHELRWYHALKSCVLIIWTSKTFSFKKNAKIHYYDCKKELKSKNRRNLWN